MEPRGASGFLSAVLKFGAADGVVPDQSNHAMSLDSDDVLDILAPSGHRRKHKRPRLSEKRSQKIDDEFVVQLPLIFQSDAVANTAVYERSRALDQAILRQQSVEAEEEASKRQETAQVVGQLNRWRPQKYALTAENTQILQLLTRESQFYSVRFVEYESQPEIWCRALQPNNYDALYQSTRTHFADFVEKCVSSSSEAVVTLALNFVAYLIHSVKDVRGMNIADLESILQSMTIEPSFGTSIRAGTFSRYLALPDGQLLLKRLGLVFKCFRLVQESDTSMAYYFFLVLADSNLYLNHYVDLSHLARDIFPLLIRTLGASSVLTVAETVFKSLRPIENETEYSFLSTVSKLRYRTLHLLWNLVDRTIVQDMILAFVNGMLTLNSTLNDCIEAGTKMTMDKPEKSSDFQSVIDVHYQLYSLLLVLSPLNTINESKETNQRILQLLDTKQKDITSQVASLERSETEVSRTIITQATALLQKLMAMKRQYQRRTFIDIFYD